MHLMYTCECVSVEYQDFLSHFFGLQFHICFFSSELACSERMLNNTNQDIIECYRKRNKVEFAFVIGL